MAPRKTIALAGMIGLSLALAACGGDGSTGASGDNGGTKADCADYSQYGDLSGKTVSIYTSIVAPEDQPQIDSYKPFEECTGAKIKYEGSKEFEAQLPVRVKSGNPPDIAFIPQPGLLQTMVATGKVVKAPQGVSDNVDK
jgi:alpha-glucoside transport system substrate-binding protein